MSEQTHELETKALTLEVKDEEKGEVEAVIATLGVVDKDGDIIREDAIPNGSKVKMSSYGHDVVFGEMPVGKGTVQVKDSQAVFRGRVFLSTERGREVFNVLKELADDQEWSFGFNVQGSEVPDEDQKRQGATRILTKLDAFEVSPVVRGAGVGTRTMSVKCDACAAKETGEEEKAGEPDNDDPELSATVKETKEAGLAAEEVERFTRNQAYADALKAVREAEELLKRAKGRLQAVEAKRQKDAVIRKAFEDELARFERTRERVAS